ELSEQLIDQLWQPAPGKRKPRTYRQQARQNYLRLSRNKRPGYRLIRKTIRKQLSYLLRNLGSLEALSQTTPLTDKQIQQLQVLKTIYEQQRDMYDKRQHKTEKRIVSVHQPWVRPIVRGKQTADTEFGAKIAISVENGYSRVEKFSFEAFNESQTLQASCERYKKRHGHYPERVLADKIYRNRKNLDYCKERGIHLNGPKLGRPPKDKKLYELQKQLEKKEAGERNMVEAKFGEAKLCYGLDRVMAMRQDTSETCVQLIFLVMNLKKRLRSLFDLLFSSIQLSRFYLSVRLVNVGQ
ncbi:MAG: transposase, partial [Alkaliphilus sp.]